MIVNINIGVDNSQLYRVDSVFVIVMQDNVDNKNGNELTHLRAEFLNQLEKQYLSLSNVCD